MSVADDAKRQEVPAAEVPAAEAPPLDPEAMTEGQPLDLRTAPPSEGPIRMVEAPPYSPEWAKILWPITRSLLALIATVMLLPFLIIALRAESGDVEQMLDWAKTVLPPVVGFGGAVVGYYFGTRGTTQAQDPDG